MTYVCLDILTAVLDFTRGLGCDEDTISKLSIPNVIQLFDSGQSLSDFQEALRGLATQAITLRDQCRGGKNSDIIRRAKDFMDSRVPGTLTPLLFLMTPLFSTRQRMS